MLSNSSLNNSFNNQVNDGSVIQSFPEQSLNRNIAGAADPLLPAFPTSNRNLNINNNNGSGGGGSGVIPLLDPTSYHGNSALLTNGFNRKKMNQLNPFNDTMTIPSNLQEMKVNENINNSLTSEIEMNLICGEYLKYANYSSTLNEFELECQKRGLYHNFHKEANSNSIDNDKKSEVYNLLLNNFLQGNRNGFMEIWLKILPETTRQVDTIAQNLEFNLNVYFAIYPIHDYVDSSQSKALDIKITMMEFKKYLETNSTKLSQSQQYIPFYALPYIPDPKNHSLFKETFTEQWVLNLNDQLKLFLNSLLKASQKPRLYTLLQRNRTDKSNKEKDYLDEIEKYKSEISSFKTNEEIMEKKFNTLKNDYGNLVTMSSELVKLINSSVNGEQISQSFLNDIHRQLAIFQQKNVEDYGNLKSISPIPEGPLFTVKNDMGRNMAVNPVLLSPLYSGRTNLTSSNTLYKSGTTPYTTTNLDQQLQKLHLDYDYPLPIDTEFQKLPYYPYGQQPNKNFAGTNTMNWMAEPDDQKDPIHFNYKQIITDLKSEINDQNLVKLIQALRLNLSRVHTNGKRKEILRAYIINDILDIKDKTTPNVITRLLSYSSEVVHLQLFKLLNMISTDSIGREYLLTYWPNIIENLITILFSFKTFTDSIFFKNILAVLQKLSLRRKAQSLMMKENLIEFIIEFLGTNENSNNYISEETLEYCIALLMNLCLRSEGKKRCCHRSKEILKILNNYIEHENKQVKTYINGTLYNLFTEHIIREQARSMGMTDLLEYLISISDPQIVKQLEFVLEQLNNEETVDNLDVVSEDGEEDDNDDDNDNDMPEIDENLILNDLGDEGGDFGYELLRKKYSVNNIMKPEMKQMIPTSPEKEYIKDEVFKRANVAAAIARQKNNYSTLVSNDGITMDSFSKMIPENSMKNESNTLMNSTPKRTPIIKNKRHTRKPTTEDYIKLQTIKPHPPLASVMKIVKEKTGITNSEEELKEYYKAFTSKPRIARTPVESISLNSISTTSKSTLPEIRPNSSYKQTMN